MVLSYRTNILDDENKKNMTSDLLYEDYVKKRFGNQKINFDKQYKKDLDLTKKMISIYGIENFIKLKEIQKHKINKKLA